MDTKSNFLSQVIRPFTETLSFFDNNMNSQYDQKDGDVLPLDYDENSQSMQRYLVNLGEKAEIIDNWKNINSQRGIHLSLIPLTRNQLEKASYYVPEKQWMELFTSTTMPQKQLLLCCEKNYMDVAVFLIELFPDLMYDNLATVCFLRVCINTDNVEFLELFLNMHMDQKDSELFNNALDLAINNRRSKIAFFIFYNFLQNEDLPKNKYENIVGLLCRNGNYPEFRVMYDEKYIELEKIPDYLKQCCLSNESIDIANILLLHINFNVNLTNLFILSASYSNFKIAEFFMIGSKRKRHKRCNSIEDMYIQDALDKLCSYGNEYLTKVICEEICADRITEEMYTTMFQSACSKGNNLELVQWIYERYPEYSEHVQNWPDDYVVELLSGDNIRIMEYVLSVIPNIQYNIDILRIAMTKDIQITELVYDAFRDSINIDTIKHIFTDDCHKIDDSVYDWIFNEFQGLSDDEEFVLDCRQNISRYGITIQMKKLDSRTPNVLLTSKKSTELFQNACTNIKGGAKLVHYIINYYQNVDVHSDYDRGLGLACQRYLYDIVSYLLRYYPKPF